MSFSNIARRYINKVFLPTRADMFALQRLSALKLGFLPTSIASMRPAAINIILNDIVVNQRKNIIEFGSGISTLYIASLLKEIGYGSLISFEHDTEWIKVVEEMLSKNDLSGYVSLEHAPLTSEHPWMSESKADWYDIEIVSKALSTASIDLLVVDGPPAGYKLEGKNKLSRFPALLAVESKMNSSCAVILDDLNRLGEQIIAKSWIDEFKDFQFVDYTLEAGIAYLKRGQGYVVTIQSR